MMDATADTLTSASRVGPDILSSIACPPLWRKRHRALWRRPPVLPLRCVDLPRGGDGEVRARAPAYPSATFLPAERERECLLPQADVCFVIFE
jgi:hypothetical protein